MFDNATIQVNPSLSLFNSTHCTYIEQKRSCHQSICDNELHAHPDSLTEGCTIKQYTTSIQGIPNLAHFSIP